LVRRRSILIPLSTLAAAANMTTSDDHAFTIFQQIGLNCHNPDKTKGGSGGKVVEPGDTSPP
jgi:hypothetical protein